MFLVFISIFVVCIEGGDAGC